MSPLAIILIAIGFIIGIYAFVKTAKGDSKKSITSHSLKLATIGMLFIIAGGLTIFFTNK